VQQASVSGWAGVEAGTTLWSAKVVNDEAAILEAIHQVLSRARRDLTQRELDTAGEPRITSGHHRGRTVYWPTAMSARTAITRYDEAHARRSSVDDETARVDGPRRVSGARHTGGVTTRALPDLTPEQCG